MGITSSPSRKSMVVMGANGEEMLCIRHDYGILVHCFNNVNGDSSSQGEPKVCPPEIAKNNFMVHQALQAKSVAVHEKHEKFFSTCANVNLGLLVFLLIMALR